MWYSRPTPPMRRVLFWLGALGAGAATGLAVVKFDPAWVYGVCLGISTTVMLVTAKEET